MAALCLPQEPREALPSLQGEGLGVGSVMSVIFYQRRSFSEEVSTKKFSQRRDSEYEAAKKLQTPPLTPPLEGRGWLRIELRGAQGSESEAAKKLQTPPLARPKDACKARTPLLEGRGWLRFARRRNPSEVKGRGCLRFARRRNPVRSRGGDGCALPAAGTP